jgi:hypothetical protein
MPTVSYRDGRHPALILICDLKGKISMGHSARQPQETGISESGLVSHSLPGGQFSDLGRSEHTIVEMCVIDDPVGPIH